MVREYEFRFKAINPQTGESREVNVTGHWACEREYAKLKEQDFVIPEKAIEYRTADPKLRDFEFYNYMNQFRGKQSSNKIMEEWRRVLVNDFWIPATIDDLLHHCRTLLI